MTVPSMDPSNQLARLNNRITQLEQQLKSLVSASGTLDSATIYKGGLTIIDPETGARMKLGDGSVQMWSDFVDNPAGFGRIYCDPVSGINYFRIYPPYTSGMPGDNAITIQGSRPDSAGNMWLYTAGVLSLVTRDSNGARQGSIFMSSAVVGIDTPQLTLFSLPAVGAPDYTLGYDFDGTNWSVCLITSAAKYKQDIAPATVDPEAVLAIEPVTFRSKTSVEKNPDAKTEFGVIADQLHELGLGELLVTYKDGEPDAAKYDRIGVALIPAMRRLRDRLDEQAETITTQQAQIDSLTKRLDALEGATS